MVKSNTATAFKFVKFKVSSFSFDEPQKPNTKYDIEFKPKGRFDETTGKFILTLSFRAVDKENADSVIIKVKSVSEFLFDKPCLLSDLPPYFYTNSIPIVFPYLRAFISTLTLQANSNVMMLGLINFTNMAKPLQENTETENS